MTCNKNLNTLNEYRGFTCEELALLFDLSNKKRQSSVERKKQIKLKKKTEAPLIAASVTSVISGIGIIVGYLLMLA